MKKFAKASARCRWFFGLLFCIISTLPAGAAPVLDGLWKGPLKVPGGELEVVFRLVGLTGGTYFATLDVPLQHVSNLSVAVEVHGDTVVFAAEEAGSRFTGLLAPDGKQLVGQWRQPGLTAPITLNFSAAAINTAPKARLTPPYREEEVSYAGEATALRLGGMLSVPPGPGPFPAVVLVSDAGPHDRDGTVGDYRLLGTVADHLTRRGIAVLRFDDRGVGASAGSPASATQVLADVKAGLQFLRSRPEIDGNRLGVIGHGEGGNVALQTATAPLAPSFVVTLAASGLPGSSVLLQQQKAVLRSLGRRDADIDAFLRQQVALQEVVRRTPDSRKAQAVLVKMLRQSDATLDTLTARQQAVELTSARYRRLLEFEPTADLNQVKCPVLLVNGSADANVAADANLSALARALRESPEVTTKKLPDVNHLFQAPPAQWALVNGKPQATCSPAALELLRSWIAAHTDPAK